MRISDWSSDVCSSDLLNTVFGGSNAVFTAVGDDKQQIMRWEGAMDDAFDQFEGQYDARRISLLCNWRSHEDLVRKIGSASCRERVCQYVQISVASVSLKKNKTKNIRFEAISYS